MWNLVAGLICWLFFSPARFFSPMVFFLSAEGVFSHYHGVMCVMLCGMLCFFSSFFFRCCMYLVAVCMCVYVL